MEVQDRGLDVGRDVVMELNALNAITFDDSIFKGDVFMSLKDFSLQVVQEKQGRNNPFAPIGTVTFSQGTTTSP